MVRSLSSSVLLCLVAAGGVVISPLCSAQESDQSSVEMQEKARRRMALQDAMQQVQEARLAYESKRYTEAVEHYRNALSVLPQAPYTKKQEKFIRDSLSDALIARAIDYRSVGRVDEAREFLREALQQAPDNQRAKVELAYTEDPVRTNPALTPQHVGEVEEVSRLLTLAHGYLDLGKYDEAIKTFQSVAQYDKFNEAARRGIEQVEKMRSRYYRSAHDATRAGMLAEVGNVWDVISHTDDAVVADVSEGSSPAKTEENGGLSDQELSYARVLEQMNIPTITFENASIDEVVEVLQNYIKRFENEGHYAQRHINIVGGFGSQDTPGYSELMSKRVSFRLDHVSMKDLLDEVCQRFDIEYYYVPLGIEFSYAGQDYGRLIDRVFIVPPHFFDAVSSNSSDNEDEEDDGFANASSSRISVKRVDPVAALKSMNISFPKGAGASYHAATRRLTVRNTHRNISAIEQMISGSSAPDERQVVLNVIVVDTTQENLEDLGFDWLVNTHLGGEMFGAGGLPHAASSAAGMPIISPTRQISNTMSPVATGGLRSIRQVAGRGMEDLISMGSVKSYQDFNEASDISPTIFGMRGVWSVADVTVLMRGLSQKKNVDTLTNPKLIFRPGNEEMATFVNVREMYYPENYDAPQVFENHNNSLRREDGKWIRESKGAITMAVGAQPTDFVRYGMTEDEVGGVGAILMVHSAEISADGQNVQLALTSVVNDFEGFIDWGSPIYSAMWVSDQEIHRIFLSPNHIFQPIFKRYMVNSAITVANGAVLVMGGLQESRIVRYEDKVPILGDLPLVGRLFRSEGEQKSRRALLIFAKVDIVDPSGHDARTGAEVSTDAPI